jgi:predicted  nucleic acid-binding Zn-ribbon protein
VSVHSSDVIVSVLQVAAGGTIVQGVLAFFRRRSELRQLDTASDNVIVGTAEHVITLLRTELDDAKDEIKQLKKDHADERADFQRQITRLGEDVSRVRAENVVMKAEIERLQAGGAA